MLTLEQLKTMQPDEIFGTGVVEDSPDGINMTDSGNMLRWVACRGGIWDWAIYVGWETQSEEYIQQSGDKVHDEHNIRKLINCDDEAFAMYRH